MPALSESAIRVENLAATRRAFALADKEQDKELRKALRGVAEPVADAAEARAPSIRNLEPGDAWARFRVGVTKTLVYVAPKERGRRSRRITGTRRAKGLAGLLGQSENVFGIARPNFAGLLMDRAMAPALAENQSRIEEELYGVLATVGSKWERA